MDQPERRLAFSRDDLTGGTASERIELEAADVESVHRRLRDRLAETDGFASFEAGVRSAYGDGNATESDRPDGRLSATFGRESEDVTISYRPYGPHGAMAMIVGAIFALPSLFVTLLLVLAGYLLYRIERPAAVPVERVTVVDVLVTGAAGEHASGGREPSRADGPGTVAVVAAAEPGYAVDSDRVVDLEWPRRKAILAHVRDWKGLALAGEPDRETVDDEFFSHFNMWWNRRATATAAAIDDAQRAVFADREGRRAYADRLRDVADRNVDDEAAAPTLEAVLDDLLEGVASSERT